MCGSHGSRAEGGIRWRDGGVVDEETFISLISHCEVGLGTFVLAAASCHPHFFTTDLFESEL